MRGDYVKLVENLLSEKDKTPVDHQARIQSVLDARESGDGLGYAPDKTAIGRTGISTIGKLLKASLESEKVEDWIPKGSRVLHAGAGRLNNPDRELLDSLFDGNVHHYDPGQAESKDRTEVNKKNSFDAVVSPFVLNVLALGEVDFGEETIQLNDREMPMNDMVNALKPDGIAIIGVRGVSDVPVVNDASIAKKPTWTPLGDGWLVPKDGKLTYQKGFTPEELKMYVKKYFKHVEIVYNNKSVPIVKAQRPIKGSE
jgi:hypothetical protein